MSAGADNVPECTVRGTRTSTSVGGQAPSHTLLRPFLVVTQEVLLFIVPLEGGMCTFSVNASVVGGMEQSFTDDAPLFPVSERHILTLYSVMELHDSATLPYAAHMNSVA